MSEEYWNKKHFAGWSSGVDLKPSLFVQDAVKYFPAGGRVLDIGTGKGGDANFFKSKGYEVVATDFSEAGLKLARENFPGIEFIQVDTASSLPFSDESFDAVYSHMALHYFDKDTTEKIFAE